VKYLIYVGRTGHGPVRLDFVPTLELNCYCTTGSVRSGFYEKVKVEPNQTRLLQSGSVPVLSGLGLLKSPIMFFLGF
jgi:hypothetical protein